MYFQGLLIGLFSFFVIGLFHPIVIQCEYHFTSRVWPLFLITGLIFLAVSLFNRHTLISPLLSVLGFTCLWSILELKEQEERVKKGWFPANPKRDNAQSEQTDEIVEIELQ